MFVFHVSVILGQTTQLPLRWLSQEVVRFQKFSVKQTNINKTNTNKQKTKYMMKSKQQTSNPKQTNKHT